MIIKHWQHWSCHCHLSLFPLDFTTVIPSQLYFPLIFRNLLLFFNNEVYLSIVIFLTAKPVPFTPRQDDLLGSYWTVSVLPFSYLTAADCSQGRIWGVYGHIIHHLFMLLTFLCKAVFSTCVSGHYLRLGLCFAVQTSRIQADDEALCWTGNQEERKRSERNAWKVWAALCLCSSGSSPFMPPQGR